MSTIRDVAKLAGVSVGTASKVMSGVLNVTEARRMAVRKAADKLNYRPSAIARALSNRESGTLGILAPHLTGSYYSLAAGVAEREIRHAGKHSIIVTSLDRDDSNWKDREALEFLEERDCDGLLVLGTQLSELEIIKLADKHKAIAFVNRQLSLRPEICFSVDHYAAGMAVAHFLVREGHSEFATVHGPLRLQDARLRHEGFMDGLAGARTEIDPRLIRAGNFGFSSGADAGQELLDTGLPFTAIFCGNDEMAMAVNAQFQSAGRQATIFGYDDSTMLTYSGLNISTVHVPVEKIIKNACSYLLNICYGGERPVENVFRTELVVRQKHF